mgnify:FL=1
MAHKKALLKHADRELIVPYKVDRGSEPLYSTVSANISEDPSMVSRVIPVNPFDLVIFGGTGDLARRKILPGLFRRFCAGQMPADARIIGAARADIGQEAIGLRPA